MNGEQEQRVPNPKDAGPDCPAPKFIFVFGSNQAGRHGKGAALTAVREHGAIPGQAFGPQGFSFAIPTKDERLRPLPLWRIEMYVEAFLSFARTTQDLHPELTFKVTRIGCGLAGYKDSQIAPMFAGAPANCELPEGWRK